MFSAGKMTKHGVNSTTPQVDYELKEEYDLL
jgi:hypothetical protein